MMRAFSKKFLAVALALACPALFAGPAPADEPLDEAIEQSVVAGLAWLADQQKPNGAWGGGCDCVARTGLAVLKFEDRALDLGYDPLDPEYEYSAVVASGLAYIATQQHVQLIGVEPAGDPDANANGEGIYFTDCGMHPVYNTGIAMMALAGSGHPELYGDLLQDACDFMCWAQADPACGLHRGGWRYGGDECNSDNSNSGYVTLGLGFAAATPPFGFAIAVPQWVKEELSLWIDVIQDDVNGDADDGGSWYDPYYPWVNILKTGNLLYEMGLVGDTAATPRVQDAIDYIERHWYDPGQGHYATGWRDHRQAMFAMMKGLEALGIDLLDLDGDGVPEHDWFAEVAQHLIDTQNVDGSWPWDTWGDQILSTSWALLTLEKAVPTFEIPVPVDVKPTSCPNPLNRTSKGVLPAAILGTADFDVTQVDPASVTLAGVSALRWALEDVATPYEPYQDKQRAYDCNELGADGYVDMTLKFDTREIAAALGDVSKGDVLVLPLTGTLLEEHGGTPIAGEDVVIVRK